MCSSISGWKAAFYVHNIVAPLRLVIYAVNTYLQEMPHIWPPILGGIEMLLKVCRCGKLIPQEMGICERCKAAAGSRHKEYNEHRRNQTAAAFYVSKQWRKMRGNILAAYDYIDLYAYEVLHEIRRADTVHHIKELNEAWERRLDITNLIPLASSTHNTIHTLYDSDPVTKAQTQATLWRLVQEAAARPGGIKIVLGDLI